MDRIDTEFVAQDLFGVGKHGFRDGDLVNGVKATRMNAKCWNGHQEELMSIIEGAGVVPDDEVFTQARQAIKRMTGGNVTTVNAANSPFVLTADNAGLVIMDATAGNIVATLPAVNAATIPLRFHFVRADATAFSVTVNRAGADTFLDGTTAFTLSVQGDLRSIVGDAASKWAAISAAPPSQAGDIFFHARNTAPTGALKANGALVSRTAYAALFAKIGTTFGAGDGATTFALPDLRAEFPRGWDDARGIDVGRVFGSTQAANVGAHSHGIEGLVDVSYAGGGSVRLAPGSASTAGNTIGNPTGETRPRNMALLACIKY